MKIAVLSARSDIHTVRWVNGLATRGHDVHLLSMHNSGGDPLANSVQLHELLLPPPVGYYGNAFQVRSLLRDLQPALLHAHFASGYGTLGRLVRYRPYVLSVWGRDVYDFPERSVLHRRILQKNLRSADQICSTSHVMAEQTRAVGASDLPSIAITPFGVDLDTFAPDRRETTSKPQGPPVVGTVKKLQKKYGIDLLLDAFAQARTNAAAGGAMERARLLIVGDGPERPSLDQRSSALNIDHCTQFVGAVPHADVPSYLNQIDVFVAVSRHDSESFGVAILEASACECPVVVSDAGGLPEVVEDGTTGWVVPREDTAATAQAITRLVDDETARREMGKAGRRHVEDKYAWSACLDRMEEVYASVTRHEA